MLAHSQQLEETILKLPEMASWQELRDLAMHSVRRSHVGWALPLLACQAVGGDPSKAIPVAAALACLQRSIILVDDMLDADPRGLYHEYGPGLTANLSFSLQASALRLIDQAAVDAEAKVAIMNTLVQMALTTSYGQQLDVQNFADEESYWQVIRTKSVPFYASALSIGALCAAAPQATVEYLSQLGGLLGEVGQLYDDLKDAMETPANPDWQQGRNNLVIRYALSADYPQRDKFCELLHDVEDPQVLNEAQGILIFSGAVGYCVYHLVRRYQLARSLLQTVTLAEPAILHDLLDRHIEPVIALLKQTNAKIPPELVIA